MFISNCFQEIIEHWKESDTYTQHLPNFTNPKYSYHISTKFAQSSSRALEEIVAIPRPEEVTFHSFGNITKMPVGITAVEKLLAYAYGILSHFV